MPVFYAVPVPTSQDPIGTVIRRSRTKEYAVKVYKAAGKDKLTMDGFRWAMYLFGGENQLHRFTYVARNHFTTFLARHQSHTDSFRNTMKDEGYPDTVDREVELNVYLPKEEFENGIGEEITEEKAKYLLANYPIPSWINRDSPLYAGWKLCEDELLAEEQEDEDNVDNDHDDLDDPIVEPEFIDKTANIIGPQSTPNNPARMGPAKNRVRNSQGQFAPETPKPFNHRDARLVEVTSKDLAVLKDVSNLIYVVQQHINGAEGAKLEEWEAELKKMKLVVADLTKRMSDKFDQVMVMSPSAMRAFGTTDFHKRRMVDMTQDEDEEDAFTGSSSGPRVAKKLFADTTPSSSAQKARAKPKMFSSKDNPNDKATTYEQMQYFKDLVHDIGTYEVKSFVPWYHNQPREMTADFTATFDNVQMSFTLVYDCHSVIFYLPLAVAVWVKAFITTTSDTRKEELAHMMGLRWYMMEILGFHADFRPARAILDNDRMPDFQATFTKWAAADAVKDTITSTTEGRCRKRLVAIENYVKEHGLVKARGLLALDHVNMALTVTDEEADESFGGGRDAAFTADVTARQDMI